MTPAPRSILVVSGDDHDALFRSQTTTAGQVVIDLASVAPSEKARARSQVTDALLAGGWSVPCSVLVNSLGTHWTYRDVIELVEGAGARLGSVVLPQVEGPHHVSWLDLLLSQIETTMALPAGAIGIEAQIGSGKALQRVGRIATASRRVRSLVLAPDDLAADLGLTLAGGVLDQPLLAVRAAATSAGISALLGLSSQAAAARAADFGFDGTWTSDRPHSAVQVT